MPTPYPGCIVSAGVYVPRLRLARSTIVAAIGWSSPPTVSSSAGSRAVGNWDEDALTMAVEAARAASAAPGVGAVTLASTSLPYADRANAVLVAEALDLGERVETLDATGTLRAGTSALATALRRGDGARTLVVASEQRLAQPGSPQELQFGDAAAALVVGPKTDAALATLLAAQHLAADFVDHYRMSAEHFDYSFEERWVREEGYGKLVPSVIAAALAEARLAADAVHHLIVPASAATAKRIAALSGLSGAQLQDNSYSEVGDCGTAQPLLMLAAALESAQPKQIIIVVGFGQGVDVLVLRTGTAGAFGAAGVRAAIARRVNEPHYTRYLAHRGLLPVDFGRRAERDQRTAQSVAWRKHRAVTAFVGGRCTQCGAVQFPLSRVCVNPACRAVDTQNPQRLADSTGRVKSFTEDWQAYTPRPPSFYGNVEFREGGNLLMEFTDVEPGELSAGDTVHFSFRIKDDDPVRAYRRYFWKAVKA